MKTHFLASFLKDLAAIKERGVPSRVKALIEAVEAADNLAQLSNINKLKATGSYYRIRMGNYRVGITAESGSVTFVRILHRREIYRKFLPS